METYPFVDVHHKRVVVGREEVRVRAPCLIALQALQMRGNKHTDQSHIKSLTMLIMTLTTHTQSGSKLACVEPEERHV